MTGRTAPSPLEVRAFVRLLVDIYGVMQAARMVDVHPTTLEHIADGQRVFRGTSALAMARLATFNRGGFPALEMVVLRDARNAKTRGWLNSNPDKIVAERDR